MDSNTKDRQDDGRQITWHRMDITRERREQLLGQKAAVIWLTGLSGSGKSTLANALEQELAAKGRHTMLLDGDNVRFGLNKDLGFSKEDRVENIRRIAETAKLMNDAGLIVLSSFISPYRVDRLAARTIIGDAFIEVYVSTPIEECEKRDVKGLYRAARKGQIAEFTGITSAYEAPEHPEITIDTSKAEIKECVCVLLAELEKYGI
ncbi:putative adenylyl-sulfate kinase [Eubacterium plexicaudatum ASF492]|uniref:Adenylyl-sulfate kinase n=1 Tax=Eubacterium plexicaudatum ASF492 TaxID=1235802 RepID=N2AGD3_9FIRM|nr:putative adenylyl-sulfate kinase [Eubacterium plexicaudatum ASF492]